MKRSPMPRRRTRLKAVNPARRKREFARCYGSAERVAFVRSLPCVVCGAMSFGASQNAHVETDGMGRKADARRIVPLCAPHHRSLHARGILAFQDRYGVDLYVAAAATDAAWQRHQGGAT